MTTPTQAPATDVAFDAALVRHSLNYSGELRKGVFEAFERLVERASQAPTQPSGDAGTITLQEVWEAAGGNPGIKPTRSEVLAALKQLDEVCEETASQQVREQAARGGVDD